MYLTSSSMMRSRLSRVISRTAAVTFLSAATSLCVSAQRTPRLRGTAVDLKTSLMAPIDLTKPADLSYSSSVGVEEIGHGGELQRWNVCERPASAATAYGRRTNYSDRWHNADGSNKYTFEGGGGFDLPTDRPARSSASELEVPGGWRLQLQQEVCGVAAVRLRQVRPDRWQSGSAVRSLQQPGPGG